MVHATHLTTPGVTRLIFFLIMHTPKPTSNEASNVTPWNEAITVVWRIRLVLSSMTAQWGVRPEPKVEPLSGEALTKTVADFISGNNWDAALIGLAKTRRLPYLWSQGFARAYPDKSIPEQVLMDPEIFSVLKSNFCQDILTSIGYDDLYVMLAQSAEDSDTRYFSQNLRVLKYFIQDANVLALLKERQPRMAAILSLPINQLILQSAKQLVLRSDEPFPRFSKLSELPTEATPLAGYESLVQKYVGFLLEESIWTNYLPNSKTLTHLRDDREIVTKYLGWDIANYFDLSDTWKQDPEVLALMQHETLSMLQLITQKIALERGNYTGSRCYLTAEARLKDERYARRRKLSFEDFMSTIPLEMQSEPSIAETLKKLAQNWK